ncbi:diguanylate cyclase [Alkalisalibacterium limincola]|uniref:diguanylate cyclase n=1 Tax=Alkalisalibacterium limincola TaxID=2699169 RepID=A0A5C8KN11_9GAMM|nr:diguanylate cyclase [Alkalisalibacterium limincola]
MVGSWIAALLACMACSLQAWGDGEASGRPMLVVWGVVLGFTLTRVLVDQGWIEGNPLTVYGIQYALAGAVFLFGLAQADRMMEFRRLRDRARQDKARVDADLVVEQVRRRLIEELHVGIRGADAKDVEWLAFRRLLEAVRSLVPQQGSSVIAFGYHGLDLLLAEPLGLKKEYTRLLARRGTTIKGLCRSRKPVNLPLEEIALPDGGVVPGGVFAVVPLQVAKPGWGVLLVRREEGSAFEPFELQLLGEFAQVAVNAADEAAAAVDLRRRAELDPLTGALNRRAMEGRLQASVERTHAERRPLALLFVDLDHFKQVNDHHGHGVGDDCLRLASDCIRRHLGKDDLFGRYGGEEFIIVLPDMRQDAARELADRIREAIAGLCVVGEANVTFTVSIGLASRLPGEKSPRSIIERADKALYQAKRGGRNRVQVASSHGFGLEGAAAEFL